MEGFYIGVGRAGRLTLTAAIRAAEVDTVVTVPPVPPVVPPLRVE